MSTIQRLADRGLIRPPRWLPANVHYETMMGSVAYGVSSDTSDVDVYGFAIPPKEDVFPHIAGEVPGFRKPDTLRNFLTSDTGTASLIWSGASDFTE